MVHCTALGFTLNVTVKQVEYCKDEHRTAGNNQKKKWNSYYEKYHELDKWRNKYDTDGQKATPVLPHKHLMTYFNDKMMDSIYYQQPYEQLEAEYAAMC